MVLTSLKNPWVKELRKLQQAKYRRSLQQFLVEGTHLVQEAIATQYPLQCVCATEAWQAEHGTLWEQLQACTERQEVVSPEILAAIATTQTPDGVVAIAPLPVHRLEHESVPQLGIVLSSLQDPGNVGTIIRTAAAVGSDGIWCSPDSVDLTHPKVLRASAGQWFRVPQQVSPNLPRAIATWRQQGCQILATASEGSVPYWEIDFTVPTVLILGNEGAGLPTEMIRSANHVISIPMAQAVESLNVGVAAAVILFEAVRQRHYGSLTRDGHHLDAPP